MPQDPEARKARKKVTDRARRLANPEKLKALQATSRAKNKATRAAYQATNRIKRNAQAAARRAANPEKARAQDAAWRAANPDKCRTASVRWYATHQEEIRAYRVAQREKGKNRLYSATYRARHPEKVYAAEHSEERRAYYAAYDAARSEQRVPYKATYRATHHAERKAYNAAHPEVSRSVKDRRRARIAGARINDMSAAQRREIKQAYGYICVYCHKKFPANQLTIDHITPLNNRGDHTLHNVTVACGPCNSKKGVGPPLTQIQPLLLTIAPSQKPKKK